MLSLTEAAGAHLVQLLAQAGKTDEEAVRVVPGTSADWALQFDYVQPDDATVEHRNRTVLVCDPEIAQTLVGGTLDVENTEEGPKLILRY